MFIPSHAWKAGLIRDDPAELEPGEYLVILAEISLLNAQNNIVRKATHSAHQRAREGSGGCQEWEMP
jgi:hypothetical protein